MRRIYRRASGSAKGGANDSTHLNRFWTIWRRRILLIVLSAALAAFLALLPPGSRRSLLFSILEQRTLIILLLSFNLLILSLLWASGERLDAWIFVLFNVRGYHRSWLDQVMWWVTQLGNGLTALSGGAFFYFFGHKRLGVELILGTLSLWLLVETIKALTDRARPFFMIEEARIIGLREPGLSFPSGHTSQVFFLAAFLGRYFNFDPLGMLALYAVAGTVGVTRIYVGAHYPRDVAAGALLGSVWGILIMIIDTYFVSHGL